ncbi:unnamed protein product [Cuscuta epithymum]|uniref:Uncharacterized protein n=1 Tax=Cuscuta epithymum TaxID=186058 RepID=A0AAV0ESM4_9ASTE|nr:unnamed protein product [Cuscuta epithymum]
MARELKFEGVVFSDAKQSKLTEVSRGGYNDHNTVQAVVEPNQKLSNPPKHYIHVRARGGQATDGHSLAERVVNKLWKTRVSANSIPPSKKISLKSFFLFFRFFQVMLLSGKFT